MTTFSKNDSGRGCRVSIALGFVLILLAVLVAVGVGLIVHFAENDGKQEVVCKCELTGSGIGAGTGAGAQIGTAADLSQECVKIVSKGESSAEICSKCRMDQCAKAGTDVTTKAPVTDDCVQATVESLRLPDHVIPIHYDVELQPYIYSGDPKDFSYKGKVKMLMHCKRATPNISLHIDLITVDDSSISFQAETPSASDPTFVSWERDEAKQFLIIKLSGNLEVGRRYELEMAYSAPMPSDLRGVYYSSYTRQGQTKHMMATQLAPTDARRAFPCFDEPALKATFNITLVRPEHLISIANMPILDSSTTFTENGMVFVKDVYQKTPKMSTYLLAFAICDFDYHTAKSDSGITYRAFAIPESVNETLYSLDVGAKVIDEYQRHFQVDYPLPKQDMIAIPDFAAGAMENWGLIMYRQTALLYKPGTSTQANKERIATIVAHELAHMWFGDLVSPAWWDDIWLNEGFASFTEYMGVDFVHPEWDIYDKFVIKDTQPALQFDGRVTSHPVIMLVNTPDEINGLFDTISYQKGASIIRMMRHFLGEETFRNGITKYLKALEYDAAHHDRLWQSLTQQAVDDGKGHIKVKEIMDTWTQQMNYPVVTVSCDPKSPGQISLRQERYLEDPTAEDPGNFKSQFGYRWTIPLTVTTSRSPDFDLTDKDVMWMTKDQRTMTADLGVSKLPDCSDPDSWILANVQQNGFYRVNYPVGNWKALAKQLDTNHTVIPVINRAQIIDDAFSLVKSGHLDLGTAMQTVEYLDKERDYVPWSTAVSSLDYIDKMLSLDSLRGPFEKFMRSKLSDLYDSIGLDNTGATYKEIDTRRIIAGQACAYGIQACLDATSDLFKQWMDNPEVNPIDVNLKTTVYCNAIRNGGWDEWSFALRMYKEATVATEQRDLLSAMACSSKQWILNHYLGLIIQEDSPIRFQDVYYVMSRVASSTLGRPLAWDFFRVNFDLLASTHLSGYFSLERTVDGVTSGFSTQLELEELEDLMSRKSGQLRSARRNFEQAVEKTRANIRWKQSNLPVLKDYLEQTAGSASEEEDSANINMRLPDHVSPRHYDVELQPYMYSGNPEDFSYKGKVKMIVRCNKPSSNVTMHIDLIQVEPASVKFYGETPMNSDPIYESYEIDKIRQFIIVKLSHNMAVGRSYIIEMSYSAKMPDDLKGVYYSKYSRNGQDKYMLTTQFQASEARRAFPCFDEPALKATFNITLVRPEHLISISNMPIVDNSTTFMEDGMLFVKDVYQTTPKMSTYLLAFVICDFAYLSNITANNIEYRAYAIPESINQARHALDVGVQLLTKYEDFFSIRYPLPKQDMIAIPDYDAGAMENWGLITYRETAMLYEPSVSDEYDKEYVAIVVAHELAHMWFGDLVTPAWWDDLWLNEGFATFVEYLGVDMIFPEWNMFDTFALRVVQAAMAYDGRVTSHPVIVEVNTREEIEDIFDVISYEKAAALIRMMRHFLSPETFNRGITAYLKSLEYEATNHNDLWAALTKTNPGQILVKQERYLEDKTIEDPGKYKSPFGYRWTIPLTLTTSESLDFDLTDANVFWLDKIEEMKSFTLGTGNIPPLSNTSGWILANARQYGYYRVNYPLSNWKALADQLNKNHLVIPTSNRAQLVDDAFNLAKSGHIGLDTALMMIDYLDKERDYVPWSATAGELSYIRRMLALDNLYGPFQSYLLEKVIPSYEFYGLDNSNATHNEIYARRSVASLACAYGVKSCLDTASDLYKQWMDNPNATNPVDVNLKSLVYCNAIRNGGWDEWQFALNMYKQAQVATEKDQLISAMSCASKPWILKYYIDLAMADNSPIRLQDLDYVLIYVSYETVGRPIAWQFIRERFHDLEKKFKGIPETLVKIIGRVTRSFNTQFELEELQTFLNTSARKLVSTQPGIQRAIAQVRTNIKWMAQNRPVLEVFLKNTGYLI
ncbi:aminopeptidase n [Plakobranchus ocellatus]|uniref:glutamyl aminopeptidase n=1 Tax=Plakobranchus ocellatus TaxID=259542 RepID=A0AAV4DTM6_9GAST|nr:aminopeptidase n [Plakobranchus ocellatus]